MYIYIYMCVYIYIYMCVYIYFRLRTSLHSGCAPNLCGKHYKDGTYQAERRLGECTGAGGCVYACIQGNKHNKVRRVQKQV